MLCQKDIAALIYNSIKNALALLKISLILCSVLVFVSSAVFAQSAFDDPGARNQTGGKGGDLVAVNGTIDAGDVALGSASQIVVLVRNDGAKPITSGDISLYPSSNVSAAITQNECKLAPLPPDAVCAIALSAKGLQPGRFRVEILMRHDGRAKLLTSTISGMVDITADNSRDVINDLETIPTEIKFGSLKESRPLTRSVILRNVTSKPIKVTSVDIESNAQAGYTLKTDCETLESGEACITTITWAPQQRGPSTGVLVVNHDGPTGVVSVILDGIYEPGKAERVGVFPEAVPGRGLLTASQTEVNFGSDIQTASSITVSLVNVGDSPVTIKNLRLSNDDNGIQIAQTGCGVGVVLNPVEACPLTLTWEPVRSGSVLDDVQILHDGARGILVLPITGTATKAINQDSKSIVFNDTDASAILRAIEPISAKDVGADEYTSGSSSAKVKEADVSSSLEGYKITSLAQNRAIVSGPGGSRVVFSGQETVIGGVLWKVNVQSSAVQFSSGSQKILLLFDRSLAPFNDGSSSTNRSSSAPPVNPTTVEN